MLATALRTRSRRCLLFARCDYKKAATMKESKKRFQFVKTLQSQADVDLILPADISGFDVNDLVSFLFHSSRKNFVLSSHQLDAFCIQLSKERVEEFGAQSVSNLLYGLHPYDSSYKGINKLLAAISYKVSLCDEEFRAQHLGNSLYGLQGMSSKIVAVKKLLNILAEKIETCTEELKPLEFGNAMYGLRGLRSNHKEVRSFIRSLSSKLESCVEPLTPSIIGISLLGLSEMESRHQEVLDLIKILNFKIQECPHEFDSFCYGGMYGLHNIYGDRPEVKELVKTITERIRSSDAMIGSHQLARAFFGIKKMKTAYTEVRSLIEVLADKVENRCEDHFESHALSVALSSIKSMSYTSEVRMAFQALAKKAKCSSSTNKICILSISSSLVGKSSEHSAVREICAVLTKNILACEEMLTMKDINTIFSHLTDMTTSHDEVIDLILALAEKIKTATPDCIAVLSILNPLSIMSNDPRLTEILSSVHDRVEKTTIFDVKPRDIVNTFAFLKDFPLNDSPQVRSIVETMLRKFNSFPNQEKRMFFVSDPARRDALQAIIGVSVEQHDAFIAAYLDVMHTVLKSTLAHNASSVSMEIISDVLFAFQSFRFLEGAQCMRQIEDICSTLLDNVDESQLEGSELDIRTMSAALYGVRGLLEIPGSDERPFSACAGLVSLLIKHLRSQGDGAVQMVSKDASSVVQHLLFFRFDAQSQLEKLNLSRDVDELIDAMQVKLAGNVQKGRLDMFYLTPTQLRAYKYALQGNDAVEIAYRVYFDTAIPGTFLIQKKGSDESGIVDRIYDRSVETFNVDFPHRTKPNVISRHLQDMQDAYLLKEHNVKTIHSDATSEDDQVKCLLEIARRAATNNNSHQSDPS